MKNQIKSIMNSLNLEETKLMEELERVRKIKGAVEVLIEYQMPTASSSPKSTSKEQTQKYPQTGKNTLHQAQETKKRIVKHLKLNGSSTAMEIQSSILKKDNSNYSKNTIRQYLSELKKTKKLKFNRLDRMYSM